MLYIPLYMSRRIQPSPSVLRSVRNTESEVSEDPFPLSSSHSSLLRLSTVFQVLPSPSGLYYDIPDHSLLCPLSSLQMRGSDDPQLLLLLYNPFNHSFLCQSGYSQSASPPATTVYESHPAVIQPLRRIHTALRADADSPSCQDFPERVQEVLYRLRRAIPQTSRRCQAVR